MNNSHRIAAAAMNTALFHMGSKPNRTPEKMNGDKVTTKRSVITTVSCLGSVTTDTEGISVCGSRMSSGRLGFPELEIEAVSDNPFSRAFIMSVEARWLAC